MKLFDNTGELWIVLLAVSLILAGCGGGGGGAVGDPKLRMGVFLDSAVEGLNYKTATQSGVTEVGGIFWYREGETVAFSIGETLIGQTAGKAQITPVDLVTGASDETDPKVTNICRLLQSLDRDGIPENGIQISQQIQDVIKKHPVDLNLSTAGFETSPAITNLLGELNGSGAFTDKSERALTTVDQARTHFRETMRSVNPDYAAPTLQYYVSIGRLPEGIKKQIETSGKADVIITFDHSDALEKARQMRETKGLKIDDAEIIAEIARLYNIKKNKVLSQIPTSDYTVIQDYSHSPIIYIEVNEKALMKLLQSPDVKFIEENKIISIDPISPLLIVTVTVADNVSPGNPDAAFGTGGKVVTDINSARDDVASLAIQSDSKIIVAGRTYTSSSQYDDFALVRYNTDGSLDLSFGSGGKVTTDINATNDHLSSVVIQSDGKIVSVGGAYDYKNGIGTFATVRYNTDGSLDTSFGSEGKVVTSISSENDTATSAAIQVDGKIVVAGRTYRRTTGHTTFAMVRYNTDGKLDTSFGINGILTTTVYSNNESIASVAIQPDNKIVVTGNSTVWKDGSQYLYFVLVRYNTDGSIDASFGSGGKVINTFGSIRDSAASLAIQADGKIIVVGNTSLGGTSSSDFAAARFNTDGSLDTSFGNGGKVTTFIAGDSLDCGLSVALQSDGKFVVAGQVLDMKYHYFAMVRYNTDGSIDLSFGTNGRIATPIDSSTHYFMYDFDLVGFSISPHPMVIQADGKLVLAGPSYGKDADFAIVRYLP